MYACRGMNRWSERSTNDPRSKVLAALEADKATVVALVEPHLRSKIAQGTDSVFKMIHVGSINEAYAAIRDNPVRALLVSASLVQDADLRQISAATRKFPAVVPIAISAGESKVPKDTMLSLGAYGIRQFFELHTRKGWDGLRAVFERNGDALAATIMRAVIQELHEATNESRQFFATLIEMAPSTTVVETICAKFGIVPSTFNARFFRRDLPTPKTYLAKIRLLYAAGYLEREDRSIADVATILHYSTPQAFSRHIKEKFGLTASGFRTTYPLQTALDCFKERLMGPHREKFKTFKPFQFEGTTPDVP